MASVTELLGRDNPDTTVRLVEVKEPPVAFVNAKPVTEKFVPVAELKFNEVKVDELNVAVVKVVLVVNAILPPETVMY